MSNLASRSKLLRLSGNIGNEPAKLQRYWVLVVKTRSRGLQTRVVVAAARSPSARRRWRRGWRHPKQRVQKALSTKLLWLKCLVIVSHGVSFLVRHGAGSPRRNQASRREHPGDSPPDSQFLSCLRNLRTGLCQNGVSSPSPTLISRSAAKFCDLESCSQICYHSENAQVVCWIWFLDQIKPNKIQTNSCITIPCKYPAKWLWFATNFIIFSFLRRIRICRDGWPPKLQVRWIYTPDRRRSGSNFQDPLLPSNILKFYSIDAATRNAVSSPRSQPPPKEVAASTFSNPAHINGQTTQ